MKMIVNKTHSTMKNEGKILELLAEMALKQDHMVEDLQTVKSEVSRINSEVSRINSEMSRINSEMSRMNTEIGKINIELTKSSSEIVKLNLLTSENTRAIFKLSDKVEQIVDHENRISKLERIVFK